MSRNKYINWDKILYKYGVEKVLNNPLKYLPNHYMQYSPDYIKNLKPRLIRKVKSEKFKIKLQKNKRYI